MQRSKTQSMIVDPGLDQGQQRILRWLERYPFQRARDLVVALSPWEGRGAVYRRLTELEELRLIESVRLGASGREKLYHLSPLGRHVCAFWNAQSGEREMSLVLREEREKLVSLLPRLPVWLLMQDLVNGLVLYAARALAREGTGEEASSVRWNWQREYRHPFVARGQANRELSVRTDGALALCLRFSDQREEWHTFLLLHCPLDEGRLLRTRLDRLVRWRESAERRAVSNQIPPVLILATSPRQAEWWQLASAQVATFLRKDGPTGAVATIPEGGQIENSWRLPWRQLGTDTPCHLQDLAHPTHAPSLPELLEISVSWSGVSQNRSSRRQEATQVACLPSYAGRRSYALTKVAQEENRATSVPERTKAPADYRLLSLFLSPREWEMLTLLFAHPLLSRDELSVLFGIRPKTVQILLAGLAQKKLLTTNGTPVGVRWSLAEAGLRLLARHASCHVRRLVRLPVVPGVPLQQRGVAGLLHQIRHTAGVYAFFIDLVRHLADLPGGGRLRWWETGAMCEHVFTYREQTYHFKPDALAAVQLGIQQVRFWLEWDRGTMGVRDLERKCATYAAYLSSREWARGGVYPPTLLYVAPEVAQERRFSKIARALLAHIPGLRLYTTTNSLLARYGVLAPVFQPVALRRINPGLEGQTPDELAGHAARVALFSPAWRTQ
jgi:DNA-binding MarR family transcriptional regulator